MAGNSMGSRRRPLCLLAAIEVQRGFCWRLNGINVAAEGREGCPGIQARTALLIHAFTGS